MALVLAWIVAYSAVAVLLALSSYCRQLNRSTSFPCGSDSSSLDLHGPVTPHRVEIWFKMTATGWRCRPATQCPVNCHTCPSRKLYDHGLRAKLCLFSTVFLQKHCLTMCRHSVRGQVFGNTWLQTPGGQRPWGYCVTWSALCPPLSCFGFAMDTPYLDYLQEYPSTRSYHFSHHDRGPA